MRLFRAEVNLPPVFDSVLRLERVQQAAHRHTAIALVRVHPAVMHRPNLALVERPAEMVACVEPIPALDEGLGLLVVVVVVALGRTIDT